MFSGSSGSPDLRFGMTSADFHACAKQFDANEEFMRLVMTGNDYPSTPLSLTLSTITDDLSPFQSTAFEYSIRPRPRALNHSE